VTTVVVVVLVTVAPVTGPAVLASFTWPMMRPPVAGAEQPLSTLTSSMRQPVAETLESLPIRKRRTTF
jgi:hypothetical protein